MFRLILFNSLVFYHCTERDNYNVFVPLTIYFKEQHYKIVTMNEWTNILQSAGTKPAGKC